MKHFFTTCKAACLAAVAALTAACGSEADYRTALPADAFVTMSFNPAQLAAKSGMGDMSQHPLCLRIEKELNGMEGLSAEEKAYCLALLKNPEETGIDGSRDAYLFLSPENLSAANPVVRGGMLLPIGDLTKFETLIDRINTRSGSETVREGELSVVRIGEQVGVSGLCAYDGAACMLYFAQDAYEETLSRVKGLFAQKREESLVGNAAVERLFSEKNDINVAVSYGVLVQENPMLASLPMAGALEGVKALGSVNFEKGRIVADGSMAFDSKEAEEELASFYTYVKPQKGSLLKYVPASTVAALGCGLNGSELYAMLSQMPGYGMLLANPMVKQVMDAFDGDLLLLFSGMLPGGSYPVASLLAEVGDPSVVDQLVANLPGMPLVKTGEGAYTVSLGTLSAFFGVKDGVLYFTTDAAVKTALDGTKIDAMAGCDEVFAGQWSSFCFDFKGLNALLGTLTDVRAPQAAVGMTLLGMFDRMEAWGAKDGGKVMVEMADKERNALETICSTADGLIREALPQE